jgi:hypothetical protein
MIRPEKSTVSKHSDQGRGFQEDAANAVRIDPAPREGCQGGIRVVWGDGDEKTAGGLRIEEKILIFGRDARFEPCAFTDEGAIVFQTAGKMAFAGGFDGARKIGEGCVIDFEGHRLEAMCWIAEGHLSSVTEETEAGHVSDGVNGFCGFRLFLQCLEGSSGGGIESAHGSHGGGD